MALHPATTTDPIPPPMVQARFVSPGCINSSGRKGRSRTPPSRLNFLILVSRPSRSLLARKEITGLVVIDPWPIPPTSAPSPFRRLAFGSHSSSPPASGFEPRGHVRPRQRDQNRGGSPRLALA